MDSKPPLVTVVMPVWNDERYLASSLESILRQTFDRFEIIVVDDGSTDGSVEILRNFKDPRIKVTSQENQGPAAARTNGVLAARSEYVAFMDSDDISEPRRLEIQKEFLDCNPRIALVGCATRIIDESGKVIFNQSAPTGPDFIRRRLKANAFCFYGAQVMVRREAAIAAGLFRKEISQREDTDFFLRMDERCMMDNVPDFLYRYRMHPNSLGFRRWAEQLFYGELVRDLRRQRERNGIDSLQKGEAIKGFCDDDGKPKGRRELGRVLSYLCLEEAQLAIQKKENARAGINAVRAAAHQPFNRTVLRAALRLFGRSLIGKA